MKPVVILSFDHAADPRLCEYTLDILNRAHIQPTLYVQSALIGSRHYRSSVKHLQLLYEHQWDLGNHSTTHPALATLTEEQIDHEIKTTDLFFTREFVWERKTSFFVSPILGESKGDSNLEKVL